MVVVRLRRHAQWRWHHQGMQVHEVNQVQANPRRRRRMCRQPAACRAVQNELALMCCQVLEGAVKASVEGNKRLAHCSETRGGLTQFTCRKGEEFSKNVREPCYMINSHVLLLGR